MKGKNMFRQWFLLFLATSLLTAAAYSEERANVPEKYKWQTADIYPNTDAWQKAKEEIAGRISKIPELQGKLGESPDRLYSTLSCIMDLEKDLGRLQGFASMRFDEDTRASKTAEMKQSAEELAVKFSTAISFMRPEILALGKTKVDEYVKADKRLEPYGVWLDDILRYEDHTLSPAEEKIAARADMMAEAGANVFEVFNNAELPYPETTLSSGEKVRLDAQGYMRYRASNNREDRDKVFKAFWSKRKEFERTFGTTLNERVKAHVFEKEVHKYDSCLSAALFDANIPKSIYTQLLADVHTNLPTLHRYLKLRQRIMGVDQLRYEDLYAPIVKEVELRYTPEEARELVLKAVEPLGQEYVTALKKGCEEGWVDYMPSVGKKSGAYSTNIYGLHPYQLLNFNGLYDDVSTLAHESGHSMHSFLSSKNQPYATHDYKTFVAEVASTLNENLLFHCMLGQCKDKDTRLFLLGSYLDVLRGTLFRQVLFAEFELRIHEMAESGDSLTGEKLSKLYLGLLKTYYGDDAGVCKIDDLYGVEWDYIPHFYYDFYVYQYATSIVASSQISAEIRAEGSSASVETASRKAYLNMLSSGSSKYPVDLLKGAGVDMETSAPFNAAIKEMNAIMDDMEKLVEPSK